MEMKSLQQMRKRLKKNQQIVQKKPVQKKQQQPLMDETSNINLPSKIETLSETPKQVEKVVDQKLESPEKIQLLLPAESQEEQNKSIQLQNNKNETSKEPQEPKKSHEPQVLILHGQTLPQVPINTQEEQIRNTQQQQIVRVDENPEKPAQTVDQIKQIIQEKQPHQQLQKQTEKSPLIQEKPSQLQQTPSEKILQPPTLQPKKSKIQMLRQKIRLKKIAQQMASSNPDIQQSPFKRQAAYELQSPTKNNKTIVAENQELIKSPQNEEKPAYIQLQQQKQKNSIQEGAGMQLETHPVHEQRDQPEVINEIQVAQNQKQAQKQKEIQLKPEESFPFSSKTTPSHSLFYQLNQLDQYLASNQIIHMKKQAKNSGQLQSSQPSNMLKDFLQQVQRLKKNLSQCQ